MRLILNTETDPAFNLAAEEILLRHGRGPSFRLWRNAPCVVIGKHQNAFQEINPGVLDRLGLPLLRRISGGGAVYHDLGNINFSVISETENSRLIDFQLVLRPLVKVLNALGLPVQIRNKSDIFLGVAKISGNAIYAWRNRVLHHGTLLYEANLANLQAVLDARAQAYESHAIASTRSPVTNLRDHLTPPPALGHFMQHLQAGIAHEWGAGAGWGALTAEELHQSKLLRKERYATWDWNYGRSPAYTLRRSIETPSGAATICLQVRHGQIQSATFSGFTGADQLAEALTGAQHRPDSISAALSPFESQLGLHALSLAKVIEALF